MHLHLTKKIINELSYEVIGAAIEVHKSLGPGLLESVYRKCLMHELAFREIPFVTEINIPVIFKGLHINTELRCDLFVDNCLAVELKAVETTLPVHEAQLLTYMKLLQASKGVLINFNCVNLFKEGQKTFVNHFFRDLPDQ